MTSIEAGLMQIEYGTTDGGITGGGESDPAGSSGRDNILKAECGQGKSCAREDAASLRSGAIDSEVPAGFEVIVERSLEETTRFNS